jgi:hypothetical protein
MPRSEAVPRLPTASLAAAGLIGGFGLATATGSRPLGGIVLAAFGIACIIVWRRRHGTKTATWLTASGLLTFAVSHALGLVIGPWPAVLLSAAGAAALYWWISDSEQGLVQGGNGAHAGQAGAPTAVHEHGLDTRRPRAGDVLLDAVADVDRLGRPDSGEPESLPEDPDRRLAHARLRRGQDPVQERAEAQVRESGAQ